MQKKITIPISAEHTLLLKIAIFDDEEEVDLDRLLKVDFANIPMEIATFPSVLNKIGILLADVNHNVNIAKLDIETLESQLAEKYRAEYFESEGKALSNEKTNESIARNPTYLAKKKLYFKKVKEQEYLNSVYWSAKSKDDKINKLVNSIQTEEAQESIINTKFKKFNYIDTHILKNSNKF